ncbi:putative TIR domain, P-loop containing nucleoside triphosphate hydrolase [Helianthus anomalus]
MASFGAKACSYDAFLSFSGVDTRNSFTDHLYERLKRAGINTFRDNEGIHKGEELQPEFKKAIEESRGSIVVLSKNYATSTWCLDELVLILEQRIGCNHFVVPVFYGVKPTDIRKQQGNFALQVKPSSKWTDQNVNKWKTALMQVADLAGHVLSGPETSFLEEVVDTVYKKLDCRVSLPANITGMASHDKEINSWLMQCNLEFLVIYGMGGSGKTTLAKYIYLSNLKKFEFVSLLEDIGDRCESSNGLHELQDQLLNDISGGKCRKIPGVSRGTPLIEDALKMNKAFIVLDDIVKHEHFVALLGNQEINAQSKIIITTTEDPDKVLGFSHWRYRKYKMTLLNDVESSQLLCSHAFGLKTPMAGFEEFVLQAVRYCEGNPLALEVLGLSFPHDNTIKYWKSHLNLLGKSMADKIQVVLQKSYESLPYKHMKMLFLHIACFFVGKDIDYVEKILEPDYSAIVGIKTLINRCLLSVSPNKKLTMHRLLQEMAKNIVRQESDLPANRSRVWLSSDSYRILGKKQGSATLEGLALDMKMLSEENIAFKSTNLKTDALNNMDRLKLLQLNFVELDDGSYENFSEDLRWLCWLGFHLRTIPPDLYMGKLVAIDMSYSKLEVFEPPMVLTSLRILNLKDSHNLTEIGNISMIPYLETLILWNCYSLVKVSNTIGDLRRLALLNMTGCSALGDLTIPTFTFPSSLQRLFLKDCRLDRTDSFPLSFRVQLDLQYLNLANSVFESLPCYNHLEKLQVLDLSFCSRLKCLLCLPNSLAELYIYGCELLERITFQSPRFTLQEFGFLGCNSLYEVEGFFKLVPIAELDETDLGHMKWLQQYQYHEVCLVGDDEVTVGRSWLIQMLYEFDIMSTSLPDIKDPNMTPEYTSKSSSLSFDVPSCPKDKWLKGINVTFKYAILDDECAWFCKISTTNGDGDLMYNPKVFGKPEFGKVCIWLSYWPIGYKLKNGDKVNVSIDVLCGLEVHECGVSLVYSDKETLVNNMECAEILGGDLSAFHLSTGAYYLCRRDFFELAEVGRLAPDWFRILVGDTVDYTEVRGWRKTGKPRQVIMSSTEVKTIGCIIHGPQFVSLLCYELKGPGYHNISINVIRFDIFLL